MPEMRKMLDYLKIESNDRERVMVFRLFDRAEQGFFTS